MNYEEFNFYCESLIDSTGSRMTGFWRLKQSLIDNHIFATNCSKTKLKSGIKKFLIKEGFVRFQCIDCKSNYSRDSDLTQHKRKKCMKASTHR